MFIFRSRSRDAAGGGPWGQPRDWRHHGPRQVPGEHNRPDWPHRQPLLLPRHLQQGPGGKDGDIGDYDLLISNAKPINLLPFILLD